MINLELELEWWGLQKKSIEKMQTKASGLSLRYELASNDGNNEDGVGNYLI